MRLFTEAVVYREYRYEILSVHLCWTLGTRQLDSWYQTAVLFWYYYSKVFTVAFLLAKSFYFRLILIVPWNSIIGFPSGRRTLILHSSFFQQLQAVTLAAAEVGHIFCPFGQLYLSIVSIGDSKDTLDDIGGVEIYEQSNFLASNP